MAKTAAERMARLRARQREVGLTTLTVVVPVHDVAGFVRLAARRRNARGKDAVDRARPVRWATRAAASTSISSSDILAFRELLETTAVTLVVRQMNAAKGRRLRAALDREAALPPAAASSEFQELHLLLGELSGDDALQLLLRVALKLTDEHSPFSHSRGRERDEIVARVKRLHAGIVESILERNEGLAVRRMRRYLSGLRVWLK